MGGDVVALIVAATALFAGLGALLRARPEAEKAQADSFATSVGAQSTIITNLQSENERQRATIVTLELRIDVLEGEMRVIKGQVNGE